MNEAEGRQWLFKLLKNEPIILQRIESESTGIGIPDIFFRTPFLDGWIELKQVKGDYTKKQIVTIPWRKGQFEWMRRYIGMGGHGLLFVFFETTPGYKTLAVFEKDNVRKTYTPSDTWYQSLLFMDIKRANPSNILSVFTRNSFSESSKNH